VVHHPAQRAPNLTGGALQERTSFLKKRSKKLLLIAGSFAGGATTPSK
jgi:hypothetical protein